jgi:hypothetical protein
MHACNLDASDSVLWCSRPVKCGDEGGTLVATRALTDLCSRKYDLTILEAIRLHPISSANGRFLAHSSAL